MLGKIDPTSTQAWEKLSGHAEKMKHIHMMSLFDNDSERFTKFSIRDCERRRRPKYV